MKKVILSTLLILSFALYVYYKRIGSATDAIPLTPTVTSSSQSENSSPQTSESSESINPSAQVTTLPQPTMPVVSTSQYKDGSYTGSSIDAFYGFIQVRAVISGGRLTDVVFLRFPNDHDQSIFINEQAMPVLKEEAITAQNGSVNIVSGATDSSKAFVESLTSALSQAKS